MARRARRQRRRARPTAKPPTASRTSSNVLRALEVEPAKSTRARGHVGSRNARRRRRRRTLEAFFEDFETAARFGSLTRPPNRLGAGNRRCLAAASGRRKILRGRALAHRAHASRPLPPRNQSRHAVRHWPAPLHAPVPRSHGAHHPARRCVLDVGTGSGILSIAAKMLGAGTVVACDIDPDAAQGSPFSSAASTPSRAAFDVVVANISEIVIGDLNPEFERVARRRILSGFQDAKGEWTCVVE